ncbi:MAG: phosphoribosyltransferase [Balneolaceae bacterium]|nr:MAG: phosphoribosyltransferase [Balneolaceae bacterium]
MFKNRRNAGLQLGLELEKQRSATPIVLAIPRGGVEVGCEVARHLDCEFAVVIARKLGYLRQPKASFGAIAEDGSLYLNPRAKGRLSKSEIEKVMKKEKAEIARCVKAYRNGEPLASLKNRVVIVVDDGVETGSTIFAAIELCKKQRPERIIVAAPACGNEMYRILKSKVDDAVILEIPHSFYGVSQVYENPEVLSDSEIKKILKKWETKHTLEESQYKTG